ncbi:MAG TPA: 3-hydroxyacyl-CoA dehydrogenase NAD-binding domain-containing protein [Povalibacter sp.]|uniref:3-hydroxyacyl-CoA dehydrogenase NAD-binding domain-containing protein n=1 Tax=Povalibacter sp. TaxID=1962978 RepID=UPI002C35E12E|nr:3-hydroxyacyl-CoA dehydrogenase NAD-binding domain-containing protein [Povalibacter sp.]HMN47078.1 3-hydroxyacyl-CoA dehydrogenase NAD-binding domain-containing protein [Povalibacter sp.]
MTLIDYCLEGPIAVIAFGDAPVNALSHATREGIAAALERAVADPAVRAIVLTGRNRTFCAGADIREFNTPAATRHPISGEVARMIESSPKPVVAAITGSALGGGLELALGCHYRVAAADALLGLPEIKLGIMPGAGGTQRLPRLAGLATALDMILSGDPVAARQLDRAPLLDRTVAGDPLPAAIEFASALIERGESPRRTRDLQVTDGNAAALLQAARAKVRKRSTHEPSPMHCIAAIEAALEMPIADGLAFERSLFMELVQTPQSKALRHVFFAERTAARIADVPSSTPTRAIASAAVIGAGTMGGGIAMCFLNAGIPVALLEMNAQALDRGVARIRETYASQVQRNRISAADAERRLALLTPVLSYEAIANADIVIEAVFEEISVKEAVFAQLDRVMKPGAILATNTSTLDVDRIARVTRRPHDVIGMHFFSPANVMRLLEVVRGAATAKDVLATAMKLGRTLKKVAVVAGVCDGFIGNRMIAGVGRQTTLLIEEGASPQQVDATMEAFGYAMGPFRVGDLAGHDIGWAIRKGYYAEQPALRERPNISDRLCELGRFGQKTLAGWYDYKRGDRTPHPSAVTAELLAAHRRQLGIEPRSMDEQEIIDRIVYALINEGARILEEGIAARASDIDVVYVTGYGFPAWRGGPMFHADTVGLDRVVQRMGELARNPHDDAAFWTPAPLLARLAAAGSSFQAFDREQATS